MWELIYKDKVKTQKDLLIIKPHTQCDSYLSLFHVHKKLYFLELYLRIKISIVEHYRTKRRLYIF